MAGRFENNTLSLVDYVIFAIVLAISAGIGIFFGCRGQKTTSEFLMGGRNMSILPVSLSLLASFLSAITLLGTPAEIYTYDIMYFWLVPSYFIMIPLAAHVYAPIFYNLKLTSVFEVIKSVFLFRVFLKGLLPKNCLKIYFKCDLGSVRQYLVIPRNRLWYNMV